jgi:dUTP pyrophosphatase
MKEKQEDIEMETVKVFIETAENVNEPYYAHPTDAGVDVCAAEDVIIAPGETKIVRTGIKVAIPEGYELQVRPRSGMSAKTKLRVANTPGTIDSGYRGEIGVIIDNISLVSLNLPESYKTWDSSKYGYRDINGKTDNEFWNSMPSYVIPHGVYKINKGDRIAQLVLNKVERIEFEAVPDISVIASDGRDAGGFGSTGG